MMGSNENRKNIFKECLDLCYTYCFKKEKMNMIMESQEDWVIISKWDLTALVSL